jgi:hypothetical protein
MPDLLLLDLISLRPHVLDRDLFDAFRVLDLFAHLSEQDRRPAAVQFVSAPNPNGKMFFTRHCLANSLHRSILLNIASP